MLKLGFESSKLKKDSEGNSFAALVNLCGTGIRTSEGVFLCVLERITSMNSFAVGTTAIFLKLYCTIVAEFVYIQRR